MKTLKDFKENKKTVDDDRNTLYNIYIKFKGWYTFENTTKHTAQITRGPATILPRHLVVLIAPVALLAAVHTGEGRDERREWLLLHELQRLLAVEVEGSLAIDEFLPVLVVVLVERWEVGFELSGFRCGWREEIAEVVEVPETKGVVHAQSRRVAFARLHDTA